MALSCTLLALSGHVLGGGATPPVVPVLAGAGALGAVLVVWAGRQRGPAALAAATIGSQLAFHLLLASSAGPGMAAHEHHADHRMVLGHALAAALTAWVLSRGVAAVWALHRLLQQVIGRWLAAAPVPPEPTARRTGVAREPGRTGAGLVLAAAHARRGPPAAATV